MAQPVDLGRALEVQVVDPVVAVVRAVAEHRVHRCMPVPRHGRLEGVDGVVQVEARTPAHQGGRPAHRVGIDEIQGAAFVILPPDTPCRAGGCIGAREKLSIGGSCHGTGSWR